MNKKSKNIFIGEAVECKKIEHPSFNVKVLMNKFGELACGTCLKSR